MTPPYSHTVIVPKASQIIMIPKSTDITTHSLRRSNTCSEVLFYAMKKGLKFAFPFYLAKYPHTKGDFVTIMFSFPISSNPITPPPQLY